MELICLGHGKKGMENNYHIMIFKALASAGAF